MNDVSLKDVIKVLIDVGVLKSGMFILPKKPTHGECCMCRWCGYMHEDCVCTHNEILAKLMKLKE